MAPSDEDFTSEPSRRPNRDRDRDDDYDDRPRRRGRDYDVGVQTSGMAKASLVLGLLSVVFCVLAGLPALLLGLIALTSINKSKGRLRGKGMAWMGVGIGLLNCFGLMFVVVHLMREETKRLQSSNNLKQTALGFYGYDDDKNDTPPAYIATKDGKPGLSWRVAILPYIEQEALYKEFHLDEPWDSPHNIKLLARMPDTYRSPKDPKGTTDTPYRIFVGEDAIFSAEPRRASRRDRTRLWAIPDGTANTILVVECSRKVPWTKPEELEYADDKPLPEMGYLYDDRFMVVMADGSVRTIFKKNYKEANFRNMIKPNDGNPVYFD